MFKSLKKIVRSSYALYAAILVIGIAAYAPQLANLGFYWDDWGWIWRAHVQGTAGLLDIDKYHRPLSGVVLYFGGLLAGENPLGWQLYALSLRLLGGIALAWMLNQFWQKDDRRNAAIAFLFLLYPGFNQQFVSVNNSRHLFPLITFFLSLGFMLKSQQNNPRRNAALALLLNLITMLTSDYYYGLEFTRPVLLWLYAHRNEKDLRKSLISALKSWLPYALLLGVLFGWRYNVSTQRNYSITVFEEVGHRGIRQLIQHASSDLWTATVGAWGSIFDLTSLREYGRRTLFLYAFIVAISGIGSLLYLSLQEKADKKKIWRTESLLFGGSALIVSLLPFWSTNLDPKLGFPNDRLLLPAALGASLLLVALIDLLKPHALQLSLFAIIIGFSAGSHHQNALIYRNAWASTSSFFSQLATRAPSLPANTTILSNQLPGRSTDNSLIAPLNWVYAPNFTDGNIPFQILYVDLRFGRKETVVDEDLFALKYYMEYPFEGSSEQVLGVFYEPPACLQIIDAENGLRNIPEPTDAALPYSRPDLILSEAGLQATLPAFFVTPKSETWCDYFEQADLARQRGEWKKVAELGDTAFGAGKTPNHPSERIPFVEGYAYTANWEKALQVSLDAPKSTSRFCTVWSQIAAKTQPSNEREKALEQINSYFACGF